MDYPNLTFISYKFMLYYFKEKIMNTNIDKKINIIKEQNSDNSRFILNVYEAYKKHKKSLSDKAALSSIILKSEFFNSSFPIIDLDKIWSKPYFYTKMRIHLEYIIKQIHNTDISLILENPSKFCKKIIFHDMTKEFTKTDKELDIVEFIQKLINNKTASNSFTFIAETIDEETLFKEEQIKKAIEIININSREKQYEKIYEEVYNYLQKDFISNNYCDFKNNKCIAQRHLTLYPFNRKNGCCFTRIRTCPHLQIGGNCNVQCMACRLFSCPYLSKRDITYYANEFVLLKAFLNKKQRKHLVFDFYKCKSTVLKNIAK